jgi:hypothetical protein
MTIDFRRVRELLQTFDFQKVFVEELGWSNPSRALRETTFTAGGVELARRPIAELAGFVVFEVTAAERSVPEAKVRTAAHKVIGGHHHEHVLIFLDRARQKSVWSWVHRREGRDHPRTHYYFRGQPGDLFIGKLGALMFDLGDFDEEGNVSIVEVAGRVRKALNVENVTRRFYEEFQKQHDALLELVQGIPDERQRRWYVSVLLNRLMFIYFLQRKGFLDNRNLDYLQQRLDWSRLKLGQDRYYSEFVKLLFFEGFAKPEPHRSAEARARLGHVRYLNGGLFLPHRVELDNPEIDVPDRAFESLFSLFGRYTWHLDDTPGGDDSEINPDVLGYIFEKYINQKTFGAYYTRPEIMDWLCEQTISRVVLDRVNLPEGVDLAWPDGSPARFDDVADLLLHLTPALCRHLLLNVLPSLSLLDPACGSGAFLVAALKTMRSLYGAVVGAVKTLPDENLKALVKGWEREHPSLGYFLKKRIITDNLYGVDLMEEAAEIARLRLFLALVASASREEDLEPLPNIDFNIMPGNSLVGLLRVKDEQFNRHGQQDLFAPTYRQLVDEKNRLVESYRHATTYAGDLAHLRDDIEAKKNSARDRLNEILREDFRELGIRFEEPTWDDDKSDVGKSKKRPLRAADIRALRPFHWDYEFDEVMRAKGGFDAIVANPPWEVFKPNSKEFFQDYSDVISKNNMRIEEFEREQKKLLKKSDIRRAWLDYLARFPHLNEFYRNAAQYRNQISVVGGKKAGTDLNLYKLFVEQCLNLLRSGGQLGIVVPSGLYTDLGAKRLREALLEEHTIHSLFGLSNERYLFEGVHHSFKVCLLVVTKGGHTHHFDAAFRINPREAIDVDHLAEFLRDRREHVELTPELVRRTSPDSLSVMELKSAIDTAVVNKMLRYPLLGAEVQGAWKIDFGRQLHMTDDSDLFKTNPGTGRLPLYEGKMIHQFASPIFEPRYWVDANPAIERLLNSRRRRYIEAVKEAGATLSENPLISPDSSHYLLAFRSIARNTDERTLIATVIPPGVVTGNSITTHKPCWDVFGKGKHTESTVLSAAELLYVVTLFNSYVADWMIRTRVSANINMFYVYQLPVPRLTDADPRLAPIASRAAKLICTTPEFDGLAKQVGLKSHRKGVTDPEGRGQLRAEIDGLVAHLYGLTEEEFAHVLRTFPVVPEPVREAARNAFRAVARGDVS